MAGDPDDKPPASSGSVEISLSDPKLPSSSDAAPESVPAIDSQPVSSGRVEAAVPHDRERSAPVRLVTNVVSGGVEAFGAGVEKLGEGVSKLGDITRKVPLVGAGVAKLGEGITKAGGSIAVFPTVAKTRRGRLLVRSAVLGFLLVFLWISAIVMLQLRGTVTVDFRPDAERVLVELSKGTDAIGKLYDAASPRLHELVSREAFVDQFTDADATLGKFREIIAINDTLVTTGPTGRVGRVSFTASYDQGLCKGSVSFHRDQGVWKLLGLGIELPPDLVVTQAAREKRVAVCKNPNDWKNPKSETYCDARAAAESILEKIKDGKAGEVFDAATPVFKQQTTRARFVDTQNEHRAALGAYVRIISVTEAKQYSGSGFQASFEVLAEFEKSSGVRVAFGFWRSERAKPWLLRSFKVVLPMPRAYDEAHAGSAGSAGSASGSASGSATGSGSHGSAASGSAGSAK